MPSAWALTMSRWWNARWSKNIWWRATTGTTRTTRAWRAKSSWNRRARELSPAAVGNWDRGDLNHWYGRSVGRVPGMWAGQDLLTHRAQFLVRHEVARLIVWHAFPSPSARHASTRTSS